MQLANPKAATPTNCNCFSQSVNGGFTDAFQHSLRVVWYSPTGLEEDFMANVDFLLMF